MPHTQPATEPEEQGAAAYKAGEPSSANPYGDPNPTKAGRHYLNARAWAMGWEAAAIADLVLRSTTDLDLLAELNRDRALAADYESRARVAAASVEELRASDSKNKNRIGASTRLKRIYSEKAATYQASAARTEAEIDRRARRKWHEFSDEEIAREIHIEKAFAQIDHPARRRGHISLAIQLEEIQSARREFEQQQEIAAAARRAHARGLIVARFDVAESHPGIIYQAAEDAAPVGTITRIDVLRVEPDAAGIDQLQPAGQATAEKTAHGWKITE